MSTEKLNRLFDTLGTTRTYAINLGENQISSTDIQIFIDTIPLTYITEIFIDPSPPDPHRDRLVRQLHSTCDNNRARVQADCAYKNIRIVEWPLISKRPHTTPSLIIQTTFPGDLTLA